MSIWIAPNCPVTNDSVLTDWYPAANLAEFATVAKPGDLIEINRKVSSSPLYRHWGIFAGFSTIDRLPLIVHLGYPPDGYTGSKPQLRQDNLADVVGTNNSVRINNMRRRSLRPAQNTNEMNARIEHFRLNQDSYNVIQNNCEHFAKFSRYGQPVSEQSLTGCTVTNIVMGAGGIAALALGSVLAVPFIVGQLSALYLATTQ